MGKIASMVPQSADQQKDTLAKNLDVLSKIRAYAIAVEHTNLQTISTPPPTWFNELNTNLATTKADAAVWTTTLEPSIVSTVPQAVVTLGNRFTVGTNAMLKILTDSGNNPTADQIQQLQGYLTWITKHVSEQKTTIATLQGTFTTFQQRAHIDYTNLTSGNASIQKAIVDDQTIIGDLTADIAVQNANITADNAAITASAIAGGVGLFVGVGMVGLGAAAGPAAPIVIGIGALIMVGSIVEMAAVIAVYSKKLAEAQNKLNQDTADLTNERQQVAALTLMNNSITNLTSLNEAMAQSLTDIADWWAIISTQLASVTADLTEAGSDMSQSDWLDFSMDIQLAQKDWVSFQSFATQWQQTATTIVNQVVVLPQQAKAA